MTPAAMMIESQFQQGMAMAQQAAMIEMMGNPMGAAQSLDQAITLVGNAINAAAQLGLPMDAFSQWMLSSLHSAQGDAASANHYYNAAAGQRPSLPPPRVPKRSASGKASQKNGLN
jgi:hypothetical protein